MLRDKINDGVKEAMKSGDKLRALDAPPRQCGDQECRDRRPHANKPFGDDDLLGLLQKMIKQRQESVELYDKGNRKELADQERGEIKIIQEFLPQQMSEAEAKAAIAEVIKQEGASGMKDMGKVMAALKAAYAGKMDFSKASALVKGQLA